MVGVIKVKTELQPVELATVSFDLVGETTRRVNANIQFNGMFLWPLTG